MAFQGSLSDLQLADIAQMMCSTGKTGEFRLKSENHEGSVFLKDGEVVHAVLEDKVGEEAVYRLAAWTEGVFHFQPGTISPEESIKVDFMNLLMEAARRQDEWEVIRKKIPSDNSVPDFTIRENPSEEVTLDTHEWTVLSKIDGKRTIEQIAKDTGRNVFEVSKIIYGLISNKLVELKNTK